MKKLNKSIITSQALQKRVTPAASVSHFLQTCRSLATAGLPALFLIAGTLSGLSHEPGVVLPGNGKATTDDGATAAFSEPKPIHAKGRAEGTVAYVPTIVGAGVYS